MNILKIPNQIINEPLQPLNLKKVDSIALHHMATDADVKGIEKMHVNQGWRAIGYNFWVAFDGSVYEGRGFNLGAGVDNQNGHIISIGFQGDYHSSARTMPDAQFNAGIDIIQYVLENVPSIRKIGGHKDFMATACPGQYFPLEEMKTLKKRDELTMAQFEELKDMLINLQPKYYDTLDACPEWARPYVQKALELGILKGDDGGKLRLTDDRIWTLVVNLRMDGIME